MPRSKTAKKATTAKQSRTKTETGEGADILKVMKWARKQGALHIKVNGIEIVFPPPDLEAKAPAANTRAADRSDDPMVAKWRRDFLNPEPTESAPPAIRSVADDPDLFARDSDAWANQTRLPRR